ncbi:MAG: hypothetical protein KBS81_08480 [Spirochaetales bacterium]|nr:hypothetical protein [Candidatus Physcosoma equi]
MKIVVYVGIDVHKDTNTVCLYTREENCFYELGKMPAGTEFVIKALKFYFIPLHSILHSLHCAN